MQKQYSQAPLPFMGQKRKFAKEFKKILKDKYDNTTLFVDLFGGSGLLSHIAKCEKPEATVVYNDYDNYRRRLENIPKTNTLLSELRAITAGCPRKKMLPENVKKEVLKRVAQEEQSGFVDYITLSSSFLFSMNYVLNYESLCRETFYNNIKMTDYNADGYLTGIVTESSDYREVFQKYRHVQGVVFLVDPPYLCTEVGTYNMSWNINERIFILIPTAGM